MKSLALATLFALVSVPAHAISILECATLNGTTRIIVDTNWEEGGREELSVLVNKKVIYDHVPVVSDIDAQTRKYRSANFSNANFAPASLNLHVHSEGGRLSGIFSEQSYLPNVVVSEGLLCSFL